MTTSRRAPWPVAQRPGLCTLLPGTSPAGMEGTSMTGPAGEGVSCETWSVWVGESAQLQVRAGSEVVACAETTTVTGALAALAAAVSEPAGGLPGVRCARHESSPEGREGPGGPEDRAGWVADCWFPSSGLVVKLTGRYLSRSEAERAASRVAAVLSRCDVAALSSDAGDAGQVTVPFCVPTRASGRRLRGAELAARVEATRTRRR